MFRQGDVLLIPLAGALPASVVPVPREDGKVVLAHGEVTGHMHAFHGPRVCMFRDDGLGRRFVEVAGDHAGPVANATLVSQTAESFLATTQFGIVKFPKSHAKLVDRTVEIGPFSLLKHDEHDAHAVPAGRYELEQQREFDHELARDVAD